MKTCTERLRHRRSSQLEFLENRSLLSPLIAAPTAEVRHDLVMVPIKLAFSGSRTATFLSSDNDIAKYTLAITALGSATQWGPFNLTASHNLDANLHTGELTITGGRARFQLIDSGDLVYAIYVGSGQADVTGNFKVDLQLTITGGTGSHSAETGKLALHYANVPGSTGITANLIGTGSGRIALIHGSSPHRVGNFGHFFRFLATPGQIPRHPTGTIPRRI